MSKILQMHTLGNLHVKYNHPKIISLLNLHFLHTKNSYHIEIVMFIILIFYALF